MSSKQDKVLALFGESMQPGPPPFVPSGVNQLAWTLVVVAFGCIVWLTLALVNAENQRNALATNLCPDPLFKGAIDAQCMRTIASREHWWQHVGYAMTHLQR